MAKDFPPEKVRAIVSEVAALLKDKKETVSVAETVSSVISFQLACAGSHVTSVLLWWLSRSLSEKVHGVAWQC